jgi:hypothetical protein
MRNSDQDREWYRDHDMALIEPSIAMVIGRRRQNRRSMPLDYKSEMSEGLDVHRS